MIILPILLFIFSIYLSMVHAIFLYDSRNEDTDSYLTTISMIQLMITLFFMILVLYIVSLYTNVFYWYIIAFILFAYGWFIFIEKLPKKFVFSQSDEFQLRLVNGYFKIKPILSILTFFVQINVGNPQDVSEEDIREMITASSESGNMEEPQKEYIENIFEFDDTEVSEICTHRSEVIDLSLEDDMKEWHQIIINNRHTFYPIYDEDEDDIIGVLDTRDYFRLSDTSQKNVLEKAVDKPFFVPENNKLDDLFREMQQRRNYFAIVLDEYGGLTGIVTLHDIVETILGEMNEEDDLIEPDDIQKLSKDKYLISGIADIEEAQEVLNIPLPVDEFETLGGYILDCYGKLLDDGSAFDVDLDTMHVHVKNMKNHRIDQMIVYLKNPQNNGE